MLAMAIQLSTVFSNDFVTAVGDEDSCLESKAQNVAASCWKRKMVGTVRFELTTF